MAVVTEVAAVAVTPQLLQMAQEDVAQQVLYVSSGRELPDNSHQLALDRLNFGVENESLY